MKIIVREAPPRSVWALQQAGIHPLLAQLYAARGVRTADELDDGLGVDVAAHHAGLHGRGEQREEGDRPDREGCEHRPGAAAGEEPEFRADIGFGGHVIRIIEAPHQFRSRHTQRRELRPRHADAGGPCRRSNPSPRPRHGAHASPGQGARAPLAGNGAG